MNLAPILSLRLVLTAAFLLVAVLPLTLFLVISPLVGIPEGDSGARHLREARSLAGRLHSYHRDLVSTFASLGPMIADGRASALEPKLAALSIQQVCAVHPATGVVFQSSFEQGVPCPTQFSSSELNQYKDLAGRAWVGLSPLQAARDGTSHMLMATRSYDVLVTAQVGTEFFQELQGDVSFGDGGHAVIVDQAGRVLAHPVAALSIPPADLSNIAPLRAALSGESSIMQYQSEKLGAEMLAGSAPVAGAGWAVMVAQPTAGITATAFGQWVLALVVFTFGLGLASAVAVALSNNLGLQIRAAADPNTAVNTLAGTRLPRVRELLHLGGFVQRKVEQAEAAEAVESELRRSAQHATEVRDTFLHNIREEMIAPMDGIVSGIDSLRRAVPQTQRRAHFDALYDNASEMRGILMDLADLSRLGSGQINLALGSFDVSDCVLSIARLLQSKANAKGLDLYLRLPTGEPEQLVGDRARLRQLVMHLAGSAIDSTEKGHVFIDVQIVQTSPEIRSIQISVSDTSPGLSADELDGIFETFDQTDGMGFPGRIGLAICGQITKAMGAGLTAESELGHGTEFRFNVRLPLAGPAASGLRNDLGALAGIRVMVAAANAVQRRILIDYMSALGVSTFEETSPDQLFTILSGPGKSDPSVDLVVCDPRGQPELPSIMADRFEQVPRRVRPRVIYLAAPGTAIPGVPAGAYNLPTPITRDSLGEKMILSLQAAMTSPASEVPASDEPIERVSVEARVEPAEVVPDAGSTHVEASALDSAETHISDEPETGSEAKNEEVKPGKDDDSVDVDNTTSDLMPTGIAANENAAQNGSKPVLVIEPNPVARSSVEMILDQIDLSAIFVPDADAARPYLSSDDAFDAVLVHLAGDEDEQHPTFRLLRDIKRASGSARRTIVGVLGREAQSVKKALVAQGLTHAIRKPIAADGLSAILNQSAQAEDLAEQRDTEEPYSEQSNRVAG